jgi:hypothetical protein
VATFSDRANVAELRERLKHEAALQKVFQRITAEHAAKLRRYLELGTRFDDIDPQFWEDLRRDLERDDDDKAALLILIFGLSAEQHLKTIPKVKANRGELLPMMLALTAAAGAKYVSKRLKQIAPGYVRYSKVLLRSAIRQGKQAGIPVGQIGSGVGTVERQRARWIKQTLGKIFGKDRAKRMADTEANLSMIGGGESAIREAKIKVVRFWAHSKLRPPRHANAPDHKCPICSPLEGLPEESWILNGRPTSPGKAHPNCDCYPIFVDEYLNEIGNEGQESDTFERFKSRLPPGFLKSREQLFRDFPDLLESHDVSIENRDANGKWTSGSASRPMNTYYRIQPRGMGINHVSETSNGVSDRLHVVQTPEHVFGLEGHPKDYGGEHPEIVEIHSPSHRDNGDVEGVEIDPDKSSIGRRWTPDEFAKAVHPWLKDENPDEYELTMAEARHPLFSLAKNHSEHFDLSAQDIESRHSHIPIGVM